MTWGKEWPEAFNDTQGKPIANAILTGYDIGSGDKTIEAVIKDGEIIYSKESYPELYKTIKEYKNKVPTHDPYTNPDAHIYYQCNCGAVLDPGTKSFAALNNAAMASGWKIRFGYEYYIPYCAKCGEEVE